MPLHNQAPVTSKPVEQSTHTHTHAAVQTEWVGMFLSEKATDLKIRYLYRGDARASSEIFLEGFSAFGDNIDLTSHKHPT